MKIKMNLPTTAKKEYNYYVRYLFYVFLVSCIGYMLLLFPETACQGISDGIDICLGTLIPSLYPFAVLSSLIINLDMLRVPQRYLSKLSKLMFNLPGKCIGIILMSFIGGFPIGGKMTKELYDKGELSQSQAQRLLLFCINPGPAFTISSVGFYMLGSKKAGLIIYLSLIASSLIIGVLSRFLDNDNTCEIKTESRNSLNFSDGIVKSVASGSSVMLSICAWVVIFSCINKLAEIAPLSDSVKFTLYCILEVTNACLVACGNLPVPIIAGIIGFGGFCTHFQVMSAVASAKLKYKYFIASRILHGALSVVICNFILKLYPVSYDVFSFGTLPTKATGGISVPISICMLTLCGLLLIGDSFTVKIKSKKRKTKLG